MARPYCINVVILLALIAMGATAQEQLRGVSVTARRPANVGREETRIDSAALRDNVSLSLADVLGFNSGAFIKDYGRATLATLSFRGTSPSHTAVTWNGMHITSPMLGTVDFSMIPSYFIDSASLLHGSSSLSDAGGGIGGLVRLNTSAATPAHMDDGFYGQYVQGVGSWLTFDEFLRVGYNRGRLKVGARVSYASSRNDFPFINHDKKENIYDDNHNIISSYHPRERNRNGAFRDLHALGSVSYDAGRSGLFNADIWYLNTNRELPLLTSDYSVGGRGYENRQRERTLRAVASWDKIATASRLTLRGGYIHQWLAYDYAVEHGDGISASALTRARSRVNTAYAGASWRFYPSRRWYFTADADFHYHHVNSFDYAVQPAAVGYDRSRAEGSAALSAKWRPVDPLGLGITLREELYGSRFSSPIAALFAEYTLLPSWGLLAKISGSRNYRFPTLNDLYTVPGGNASLRPERGYTYDAGLSLGRPVGNGWRLAVSANWFDSYIDDWILWLPSPKGYYVPRNIARVHAYGVESQVSAQASLPRGWTLSLSAHYSWTASINTRATVGDGDKSVGKQLPYIPRHSASAVARAGWRGWELSYKWQWHSERFTMTSNEASLSGHLPAYTVNNASLAKNFNLWRLRWQAKLAVDNILGADYQTVLSRPMPGRHFEAFLSVDF